MMCGLFNPSKNEKYIDIRDLKKSRLLSFHMVRDISMPRLCFPLFTSHSIISLFLLFLLNEFTRFHRRYLALSTISLPSPDQGQFGQAGWFRKHAKSTSHGHNNECLMWTKEKKSALSLWVMNSAIKPEGEFGQLKDHKVQNSIRDKKNWYAEMMESMMAVTVK